jgi:hypothetical protein
LQELRFGTDWYQIDPFGIGAQYDSPYRSLIRHRGITSRGKTMLEELPDRRETASVAGKATGTNLKGAIDQKFKEAHRHEY